MYKVPQNYLCISYFLYANLHQIITVLSFQNPTTWEINFCVLPAIHGGEMHFVPLKW